MRKKKIWKRIVTIGLAAMMLLGTSATSFAAENAGETLVENVQKGSLTIHKYRMADTELAGDSNTGSGGKETQVPEGATALPGVTFRITKVNADGNEDNTWETPPIATDSAGQISVNSLPLGRYKVEELGMLDGDGSQQVVPNTKDPAMIEGAGTAEGVITTKAFYVDVPMTASDGKTLNYDVHVYPKNEVISIDKDVTHVGNKDDSFDMNAEQTWIINSSIPGNIAVKDADGKTKYAKKYEIVDVLDTQLTYKGGEQVYIVDKEYNKLGNATLTAGTHYTLTVPTETEGGTFKVALTDAGKQVLKDAIGRTANPAAFLQVRFNTVINKNAGMGIAIPNGAKLDFENSYGDNAKVSVPDGMDDNGKPDGSVDKRPEVHTGAVGIKKIANDTNDILQGVEFMIFSDSIKADAAVKLAQSNKLPADLTKVEGALQVYDGSELTKVVTTDGTGIAKFKGLAYYTNKTTGKDENDVVINKGEDEKTGEKEYYIVEVKTAKGYQLPNKYYTVKISQTTSLSSDPSFTITNTKGSTLPKTGGRGTIIFTVTGLLIMAAAGVILLKSRKRAK